MTPFREDLERRMRSFEHTPSPRVDAAVSRAFDRQSRSSRSRWVVGAAVAVVLAFLAGRWTAPTSDVAPTDPMIADLTWAPADGDASHVPVPSLGDGP